MNNEQEKKTLLLSTITSVLLSLTVVIGVVSYLIIRAKSLKAYKEKWKDYDECGY